MSLPNWVGWAAAALLLILIGIVGYQFGKHRAGCNKECQDRREDCVHLARNNFWHMVIGFGIILYFVVVDLFVNNQEALNYFSFASTIASIILSVIAIIMTIINEQKSDNVKTAIDNSVRSLKDSSKEIAEYAQQIGQQRKTFEGILAKSEETLNKTVETSTLIKEMGEQVRGLKKDVHDIKSLNVLKEDAKEIDYQDAKETDYQDE